MGASWTHAPGEPSETYDLPIEDYGSKGDGIGYGDGFAIIVPDTLIGAGVAVDIETVHDSFALATAVEDPTDTARFLA